MISRLGKSRALLPLLALLLLTVAPDAIAQAPTGSLEIVRDGGAPLIITGTELSRMTHSTVEGNDHGKRVKFSGVPMAAVLKLAGVAVDSVRGPLLSTFVIAVASDGYRSVFSLGELAPDIGRAAVFIVDQREGAPLAAGEGPLRLVVGGDQRSARWVRQLTRLEIRRASP